MKKKTEALLGRQPLPPLRLGFRDGLRRRRTPSGPSMIRRWARAPTSCAYIARGFRVEVTFVDPDAAPKVAATINVRSAHAEGLVTAATADSFTFGWWDRTRTMVYSAVTDHAFGWWFYGHAARRAPRSSRTSSRRSTRPAPPELWLFACAGLTWDAAEHPLGRRGPRPGAPAAPRFHQDHDRLHGRRAGRWSSRPSIAGTARRRVDMTVALDTTGDLQTVVGSFVWNAQTNLATFTLPVLPADWEALLTPAVNKVKIWVRPVKTDTAWSWHAYSVHRLHVHPLTDLLTEPDGRRSSPAALSRMGPGLRKLRARSACCRWRGCEDQVPVCEDLALLVLWSSRRRHRPDPDHHHAVSRHLDLRSARCSACPVSLWTPMSSAGPEVADPGRPGREADLGPADVLGELAPGVVDEGHGPGAVGQRLHPDLAAVAALDDDVGPGRRAGPGRPR
ncbi:MAG: hypothetical protein MZV63_64670 [Marinilabiliales bacterium]|nr:hypothetical protein [Marinilabiliales bacterium]